MLVGFYDRWKEYLTRVSVWEKTAAAVLELGVLVQSPMPQILLCLVCLRLNLSTSKNPAASASPDSAMYLCALMGGTMCRKSKVRSTVYFVCKFWKMALLPAIYTRLCCSLHWML